MKARVIAICDSETEYALRLSAYMNKKKELPFQVHAFTSQERFRHYAAANPVSILLIAQNDYTAEVSEAVIPKIIILSNGPGEEKFSEIPCIYKYQSSEKILSEIIRQYELIYPTTRNSRENGKDMKIIGVYSPIARSGKTTLALNISQMAAKQAPVLYINLEGYSGFIKKDEREGNTELADLVFRLKQNGSDIQEQLEGMIQSYLQLDCMIPAVFPQDLAEMTIREWETLINEVEKLGRYHMIIIDFDRQVNLEFLSCCQKAYMPVLEDEISQMKLKDFEHILERMAVPELAQKIERIHPPYVEFCLDKIKAEQYQWETYGAFVRQLVEQDLGKELGRGY